MPIGKVRPLPRDSRWGSSMSRSNKVLAKLNPLNAFDTLHISTVQTNYTPEVKMAYTLSTHSDKHIKSLVRFTCSAKLIVEKMRILKDCPKSILRIVTG